MHEGRGILYIAFGDRYIEEAKQSISTLRRMCSIPVAVITDEPWQGDCTPDRFVLQSKISGWASKPSYMYGCSPFTQTLFVDTDTVFLSDPSPIFGLLDHYDIGVQFNGPMLRESPSLDFHTQCNSGVILFKKSAAVEDLFRAWHALYAEAKNRHADVKEAHGLADQRSLSIAIARWAADLYLAENLDFALFETILTYSPVVILHGRGRKLAAIGKLINQNWDVEHDWQARLWLQNIKGVLPRGSGLRASSGVRPPLSTAQERDRVAFA